MNDAFGSRDDAANRGERLRERGEDQVDLVAQPEVTDRSCPVVAEHAERMCFVDEYRGTVLFADGDEPRQVDDRAFHREDSVGDNKLAAAGGHTGELSRESVEIA